MGEKIMKKKSVGRALTAAVAVMLALTLFAGMRLGFTEAKAEEAKVIDMYLIAGQSNAAGYSPVYDSDKDKIEKFQNVWYAGMTDNRLCGSSGSGYVGSDSTQSFNDFKKSVTTGLGRNGTTIGPEYGIAKTINEMYADSDKQAMIFKTAAGGTSLLDDTRESSRDFGNWYPRSLWKDGYDPDISAYSPTNAATGILYKLFVENFGRVYNELVDNGYKPVVKGMAWMQGETNLNGNFALYGTTLQAFITDIRNDLMEITGDDTLTAMPFVIGKIAPTFAYYNNPNVPKMHEQQEAVANAMGSSVITVSTDDLIIVGPDGRMPGCPDNYHFCFNDALTLGQRFGEKILELNGKTLVTVNARGGGKIGYTFTGDNEVSFTLTPDKHCHLQSLTLGGQDVTDRVTDGNFVLTGAPSRVYADAVFAQNEKLALTYANPGNGAEYLRTDPYGYKGETLSVKVYVSDGYTLEKVTFNGENMTYNEATDRYEITLTESGEVAAVVTQDVKSAEPEKKGGCGSEVTSSLMAAFATLSVMLIVKRIK